MAKRVLVFDDEEVFALIVKTVLKKRDIEVFLRSDCEDIIQNLEVLRPQLILMDNKIPPMGGIEATRTIKKDERFSSIPVIYFSAHDDIKELAEEAGADGFLAKPFEIDELELTVMKYINNN